MLNYGTNYFTKKQVFNSKKYTNFYQRELKNSIATKCKNDPSDGLLLRVLKASAFSCLFRTNKSSRY
jgi:hypothetical protein